MRFKCKTRESDDKSLSSKGLKPEVKRTSKNKLWRFAKQIFLRKGDVAAPKQGDKVLQGMRPPTESTLYSLL